jgi:hypothetical protein
VYSPISYTLQYITVQLIYLAYELDSILRTLACLLSGYKPVSVLKTEIVCSCELSINFYQTTRRHITIDGIRENLNRNEEDIF